MCPLTSRWSQGFMWSNQAWTAAFPGVAALVPLCAQKGSCSRDLTSVKHPEQALDQISSSQTGLPPWARLLASLADTLSLGS